jgi:hypothetical protein
MKLAQILGKYIDTESIKDMMVLDFSLDVFSQMDVDDIIKLSQLLLPDGDLEKMQPDEIIASCTDVMIQNGIIEMLGAYKQIGFG